MHAAKTWWRGLGGLLAAAVIAVLACGPSMDALICGGEGLPAVGAPEAAAALQADASGDHHASAPDHVDGGLCPHGHCHDGTLSKPALEAPTLAILSLSARLPIPATALPVSNPLYGLDRPPRA